MSKETDFNVERSGILYLLDADTPQAKDWLTANVEVGSWWGGSAVIEGRYIVPILQGILADGLTVSMKGREITAIEAYGERWGMSGAAVTTKGEED